MAEVQSRVKRIVIEKELLFMTSVVTTEVANRSSLHYSGPTPRSGCRRRARSSERLGGKLASVGLIGVHWQPVLATRSLVPTSHRLTSFDSAFAFDVCFQ